MGGKEGDVLTRYPTKGINADKIRVQFISDGSKQAWGFKLYVEKCDSAE